MELFLNITENENVEIEKSEFLEKKSEFLEIDKNDENENIGKSVKKEEKIEEIGKSVENIENIENIELITKILKICGFVLIDLKDLDNLLIPRDLLLNTINYNNVKEYFEILKKTPNFSSSTLTCLHKDAGKKQKWPLLNLVRQILKVKYYRMKPYRKAAGKDASGKKRYIRYFLIEKMKEI